jgi:hypothetical protein
LKKRKLKFNTGEKTMTKEEALPILLLLSRLEVCLTLKDTPDYVFEQLSEEIDKLMLFFKNDKS